MTLEPFWLILALVALGSIAGHTGLLWLTSRIVRAEGATATRAFVASAAIWSVWILAVFVVQTAFVAPAILATALWPLAVTLPVALVGVKWALKCAIGRASLALLLWCLLGAGAYGPAVAVIRSTLLESFSVPTGSLAPTIIGTHLEAPCTSCGFAISVGVRLSPEGAPQFPPGSERQPIECPNCSTPNARTSFVLSAGDQITLDKLAGPTRWDLVALWYPADESVLYVERLIGLPGEAIEIARGDVFANGRRLVKPPGVADDMWIPLHDSSHAPVGDGESRVPWSASPAGPESGWTRDATGWRFSSADAVEQSLEFAGTLTSDLAYGALSRNAPRGRPEGENVGDVRIDCVIGRFGGAGHLGFRWEYGGRTVRATLSPSGALALTAGDRTVTGAIGGAPFVDNHLSFALRDGHAHVAVNGSVEASLEVFPGELEAFKAQVATHSGPCNLSILGANCDLLLSRVQVSRDVHYESLTRLGPCHGCAGNPIQLGSDEHYLLGDNTLSSYDSRFWTEVDPSADGRRQPGTVSAEDIVAPVRMISWPPRRWRFFHSAAQP